MTIHYFQGKNDTACYSYDIFSSFAYHKKLVRKSVERWYLGNVIISLFDDNLY